MCGHRDAVEMAHIVDHHNCLAMIDNVENNSPRNFLLLCANHHTVFDRRLMTLVPTETAGMLKVAPTSYTGLSADLEHFIGTPVRFTGPDAPVVELFFWKQVLHASSFVCSVMRCDTAPKKNTTEMVKHLESHAQLSDAERAASLVPRPGFDTCERCRRGFESCADVYAHAHSDHWAHVHGSE